MALSFSNYLAQRSNISYILRHYFVSCWKGLWIIPLMTRHVWTHAQSDHAQNRWRSSYLGSALSPQQLHCCCRFVLKSSRCQPKRPQVNLEVQLQKEWLDPWLVQFTSLSWLKIMQQVRNGTLARSFGMDQLQMTFHSVSAATIVVCTLNRAVWYDNSSLGHVDWWLGQNISLASTEGDLDWG